MAELREGESIEIEGNKGRRYILLKRRGLYSCTCPSWKMCPYPIEDRTCKHIERFLDDDDDENYIVEARKITAMRAAGKRVPLDVLRKGRLNTSSHPQLIEDPEAIEVAIERLAKSCRLWLDTEVADWKFGAARVSLIQAMPAECDPNPANVVVLDVLHYPDLIQMFERKIMAIHEIEKVFHNASYDLRFLSGCGVNSVVCTQETARRIGSHNHSLPAKVSLKALAEHFGLTDDADKTEQKSDWSVRPLSTQQIDYAISDIVYLRGVHLGLLQLMGGHSPAIINREPIENSQSAALRDVTDVRTLKFEAEAPPNDSRALDGKQESRKLPPDVHLTWYRLTKYRETIAELAKNRGGEAKVYNHLAQAIQHGKEVDIRAIVTLSVEKKLSKVWQQLPSKKQTAKGLQDASKLSLPLGVFKCISALFKQSESQVVRKNALNDAPVTQSTAEPIVQPRRIGIGDRSQRAPKIVTRMAINLTDEQLRVLDTFKDLTSLKIHAFAGAGKTQTLVEIGNSTSRRGVYLSFNKKNAAEATKRFSSKVNCMTTHGIAYRSMIHAYSIEKMTHSITVPAIRTALDLRDLVLRRRWTTFELASLTLGMLRDWLRRPEESFNNAFLPEAPFLRVCGNDEKHELQEHCRRLAAECWQKMKSASDAMPLSHDGYLKLWALAQPQIQADYIMLDEAQDSNAIILDVLSRQSCQKIMVGDRHQQIYEWRGAIDAMTRLSANNEQYLTQTFRFGEEIAAYANAVLKHLGEPRAIRVSGETPPASATSVLKAFLARTNAAIIEELMSLEGGRWRVHIQGGTMDMERLVQGMGDLMDGRTSNATELIGFASWEELLHALSMDEGSELFVMVKLIEKFGVDQLLSSLRSTVQESENPDIVLSTVHKAKGLEWDCVELSDDLMRRLSSNQQNASDMPREELRLLYVAVTRARKEIILPAEIRKFLDVTA